MLRSAFLTANDFDLVGRVSIADILRGWRWLDFSPRSDEGSLLVRLASHALFQAFGLAGWKYAAFCLTLLGCAAGLVYVCARRFIGDTLPAVLAAALFIFQPAHAICASHLFMTLSHMLATIFSLSAILLFIAFLEHGGSIRYWASVAAFSAGLLGNEVALATLLIGPLWCGLLSPAHRPNARRWARLAIPFLLVAALYGAMGSSAYFGRWSTDSAYSPEGYRFGMHAFASLGTLLSALISPSSGDWSLFKLTLTALIGTISAIGLGWVPRSLTLAATASIFVALTPFLWFVDIPYSSDSRYACLASTYFCLFLAAAAWKGPRALTFPIIGLVLLGWATKTYAITDHQRKRLMVQERALTRIADKACGRPSVDYAELSALSPEISGFLLFDGRLRNYLHARCQP